MNIKIKNVAFISLVKLLKNPIKQTTLNNLEHSSIKEDSEVKINSFLPI